MNWLESIYEVAGSPYPRLSIAVAGLAGAIVFGGAWCLIGRQYEKDHSVAAASNDVASDPTSRSGPTLLPPQERLLELLAEYQKRFAASKLVISRSDGRLHFDDDLKRGTDVSIIQDLYGVVDVRNAGRFEELMQSMPPEYVRLIAEARWDNPFVVSVTEAGIKRLESKR